MRPPSLEAAKNSIESYTPESEADYRDEIRRLKSSLAALQLRESRFVSASRIAWSAFLGFCIFVSLAFQIGLTIAVGLGALDFARYPTFLAVVAGSAFAQIVGLSGVVLKWLFGGRRPDEMLHGTRP